MMKGITKECKANYFCFAFDDKSKVKIVLFKVKEINKILIIIWIRRYI